MSWLSMYLGLLYINYYQTINQCKLMIKNLSKTFNMNSWKLLALQSFFFNSTQKILLIIFSLGTINTGFAPHSKVSQDKANDNSVHWNLYSNTFITTLLPPQVQRIPSNNTYTSWSLGTTLHRQYMKRCKKFYENRHHTLSGVGVGVGLGVDYLSVDDMYDYKRNSQISSSLLFPTIITTTATTTTTTTKTTPTPTNSHTIKNVSTTTFLRRMIMPEVDVFVTNDDTINNNFDNLSMVNNSMSFGTENLTVVTTQVGANAHIPCVVRNIGDGVVSWIRKKDYHLLTVGLTVYSSDERFSTTHHKQAEDWTLQIKYVQPRDAGIYECQVSTHPPTSIFLHLNVVEARAEISGPLIRYLTPDSMLRLHCRILQNTETSDYIFWYNDNRMINYDTERGINVSTEPDFQSSELIIARTRREHSGNYTCVARNAQSASVLVHIFKGDNPAAMYHGDVRSTTNSGHAHLKVIAFMMVIAFNKWRQYYN